MLASSLFFFVLGAVSTTPLRPELIMPEPVTSGAQLLHALGQAEDDFARVRSELGLLGAAPLVGLKEEKPARPAATRRSGKPRVEKATARTHR
jgi:hypothetical protein